MSADLAIPEFAGAACLLCRPPKPAFSVLFFPYPPNPLPRRGRGDSRLFHARGFAPCIPGAESRRHRNRGGISRAGGGLAPALPADLAIPEFTGTACLLCRLPTLPLVCFIAPYPPSPLPRRGRGRPKDYFAGGFAPGIPALNRSRHLQTVPNRYPEAEPGRTGTGAAYRALAGSLPRRCRLTLPSLSPTGGCGGWGCRPALPLVCFAAPYPPSPLPRRGRGRL